VPASCACSPFMKGLYSPFSPVTPVVPVLEGGKLVGELGFGVVMFGSLMLGLLGEDGVLGEDGIGKF